MSEVFALQLGGLSFEGGAGNDGYYVRSIIGWDELPDARGSFDAIPGADGSFPPEEVFRESRVITIGGVMSAGTRLEVEVLRARMMAALKGRATLRVSDELGTLSSDVRVDKVRPDNEGTWQTWIDFTIDLEAPDSIRYRDPVVLGPIGLPVRSGGLVLPSAFPWNFGTSIRPLVTVDNSGKVPTFPIVRVQGSASGITVHGGPRRIEFGAFAGELVIDNRARRVWLNGGEVTRQLIRRDWQSVPAESSQDFFFEASDAAPDTSMTVEYRIGAW